ncbi:hypothetical protein B835_2573 [Enterococcus mundtii 3F]|uniref:hypothetical protein n=1 Tax=Enterococcus mundtii TaxID=53346 RepID=UPI002304B5ED|nr:hypothetical protein [Enterococcus mundtii]MDA9462618.1 hypothetical protein [Enterococcus mundtii 3F]
MKPYKKLNVHWIFLLFIPLLFLNQAVFAENHLADKTGEQNLSQSEKREEQLGGDASILSNDSDEASASETNRGARAYGGTGTEADPYTVASRADLIAALNALNTDAGVGPYHIKFTADIYFLSTAGHDIYKDVIIDGQGFYMLSGSYNQGAYLFRVQTSNINVTIKNLNFGKEGYSYGGNEIGILPEYGILTSANASIPFHLSVENITVYSSYTGRRFFSENQESTITFYGENTINLDGTFLIPQSSLIEMWHVTFAENSTTYLNSETRLPNSAIFNARLPAGQSSTDQRLQIHMEDHSEVIINANIPQLGITPVGYDLFVGQGSKLIYQSMESSEIGLAQQASTATSVINVEKDAQVTISTYSEFSPILTPSSKVLFNVNEPELIRFKKRSALVAGAINSIPFNRLDGKSGEIGGYQFNALDRYGRPISKDIVTDQQFVLSSLGVTNEVIYQKKFDIPIVDTSPEVDLDVSELTTTIETVEPSNRPLTNHRFILSKEPLWSGTSINTEAAQTQITTATSATSGVIAIETSETERTWKKEKLRAGTYYVYVKVTGIMQEDPELQKYLSDSLWKEVVVDVPKSVLSVEVPLEKFFNVRETGEFDQLAAAQPIISRSNFPIDFSVTEVTEHSSEETPVTLVNDILQDAHKHLRLHLAATNGQHSGPLILGENQSNSIEVLPFLNDPLKLYLKGEYSGPIFEKHDVRYRFIYTLTAQS